MKYTVATLILITLMQLGANSAKYGLHLELDDNKL